MIMRPSLMLFAGIRRRLDQHEYTHSDWRLRQLPHWTMHTCSQLGLGEAHSRRAQWREGLHRTSLKLGALFCIVVSKSSDCVDRFPIVLLSQGKQQDNRTWRRESPGVCKFSLLFSSSLTHLPCSAYRWRDRLLPAETSGAKSIPEWEFSVVVVNHTTSC